MENWMMNLRYVLMPSRHPVKGHENEYRQAFDCWKKAWVKHRMEVGLEDKLYSDSFIIPDEMGCIFLGDECVGMSCFGFGSMDSEATLDHSYFKGWTDLALQKLRMISNDVILCSQFTIHPAFTGKNHAVRWKDILSLYTLLRFQHSTAGVMAGQLNLGRKMDEAAGEGVGATVLERELPYHYGQGARVMLVAYEKDKIDKMIEAKELRNLCDLLWSKLENHTEQEVISYRPIHLKAA